MDALLYFNQEPNFASFGNGKKEKVSEISKNS